MLRPTVSRPVCLGIKHPSGNYDQTFITVRQSVGWCGTLSLTRGSVCHLQLLLVLASVVILGSESFYCLRFETSLFVASYDTQGYGGGIRPRLHAGYCRFSTELFFITTSHGPNRKYRSQQFLYCCLRIRCRGNFFTEPLPNSWRLLWLQYSGLQASCHNM
jgi:hypothetical protein